MKNYRMRRIQYSAFVGELAPKKYHSLVRELRRIISRVNRAQLPATLVGGSGEAI